MKKGREPLPTEKVQVAKKLLKDCTSGQLMTIWDMVEKGHNELTELDDLIKRREFSIDNQVRFKAKHGETIIGRVKKVNTRTLSITETGTHHKWRVPFNYVEKID